MFNKAITTTLVIALVSCISVATAARAEEAPALTELLQAAKAGDCAAVEKLAAETDDIDARDEKNYTALFYAVVANCNEAARALIEHGADVNAPNDVGERPLDVAAVRGNIEMLKLLHDHGAETMFVTGNGDTLLYYATLGGSVEAVKLVTGYVREAFEKEGASPEEVDRRMAEYVNVISNDGTAPIMNAVWRDGSLEMCKLLVGLGADIYVVDPLGITLIEMAGRWGKTDIVDYLRELDRQRQEK